MTVLYTWYILTFYVVILVIFVFCYGRILVVIRRQASVMAGHSAAGGSSSALDTHQARSARIQSSIVKTMIIVSAFYAFTRLPGIVALIVAMADSNRPVPTVAYSATNGDLEKSVHITHLISSHLISSHLT